MNTIPSSPILMLAIVCLPALAQTLPTPPSFEVASIKLSQHYGPGSSVGYTGGPETASPTRWQARNMPLPGLVKYAFDYKIYSQLSYPPWMNDQRFDIAANVAIGATKQELRIMLQNLLIERFQLKFHMEKRVLPSYILSVAKDGPKFTKAAERQSPVDDSNQKPVEVQSVRTDKDGFPILSRSVSLAWSRGKARWHASEATMESFVTMLSNQLQQPVIDSTGLKDKYDMTLSWVAENNSKADDSGYVGPPLLEALPKQLGLRLDRTKAPLDVMVIDYSRRAPIED